MRPPMLAVIANAVENERLDLAHIFEAALAWIHLFYEQQRGRWQAIAIFWNCYYFVVVQLGIGHGRETSGARTSGSLILK